MAPVIGITSDVKAVMDSRGGTGWHFFINAALADSVKKAGGDSLIVPFCASPRAARAILARLDGLLISGGDFDIAPSLYGVKRRKGPVKINHARTISELHLLKAAIMIKMPVLGICGGHQLINVCYGGTLYQDIGAERPESFKHEQKELVNKTSHPVNIAGESLLAKITGVKRLAVNSTHHQSVKLLGKGLVCTASAGDGVVEAVEPAEVSAGFVLGVQWHPEFLTGRKAHLNIFRSFIRAALSGRRK